MCEAMECFLSGLEIVCHYTLVVVVNFRRAYLGPPMKVRISARTVKTRRVVHLHRIAISRTVAASPVSSRRPRTSKRKSLADAVRPRVMSWMSPLTASPRSSRSSVEWIIGQHFLGTSPASGKVGKVSHSSLCMVYMVRMVFDLF